MRGRQKLYTELLHPKTEPSHGSGKRVYMERRDEALIHRYYFYTVIIGKSYEHTLAELVNEFYLSERAVILRLEENYAALKDLLAESPKVAQIRLKYPYYSWAV